MEIKADVVKLSPALPGTVWTNKNWNGDIWQLAADWNLHVKGAGFNVDLLMHETFPTDGGSVPPPADTLIKPLGAFLLSFLGHDGIYGGELLSRQEADYLLLLMLQAQGMGWVYRNGVYAAVRMGGAAVWKEHTAKSIAGARKLLDIKLTGRLDNSKDMELVTTCDLNTDHAKDIQRGITPLLFHKEMVALAVRAADELPDDPILDNWISFLI